MKALKLVPFAGAPHFSQCLTAPTVQDKSFRVNPSRRGLAQIAISIALLSLISACGKNSGGGSGAATRLEQVFPLLESLHVIAFRHDDWCQAIEYKRGRYASSSGRACVGNLSGSRRPFDDAARRDHATVLAAIRGAHEGGRLIKGIRYDGMGDITFGIFDCGSGDGDLVYVFSKDALDPGQTVDGNSLKSIAPSWYRSR
jgi:hypothetical protein